ncbi:hypothetical protein JCM11491_000673 [Sporobolomyces phaffii]
MFTYLYHHYFTTLSQSSTIVTLCRSLRTATSTGLSPQFRSVCHASSSLLNSPPTAIQRFLLVTKEVVLGIDQAGEGDHATLRSARNWKVFRFAAIKLVGLVAFFSIRGRHRQCTSTENLMTGSIRLDTVPEQSAREQGGHCVSVLVLPDAREAPQDQQLAPPAYTTEYESKTCGTSTRHAAQEEEEGIDDSDDEEEDFPWIVLALSLIGHLLVVLLDHGAIAQILDQTVLCDKWAAIGCFLICTGVVGIWREMSLRSEEGEELQEVAPWTTHDEKRRMVVIEL